MSMDQLSGEPDAGECPQCRVGFVLKFLHD